MLREHGGLKQVVRHLRERQAEREEANAAAAAAAEASSEDEGEEEDADEEMRDADKTTEKGGSDDEMDRDGEDEIKKVTKGRGKAAKGKGKKGAKGKGGVMVPESWPWERAKELFLKPDVTPAEDFDLEWKAPDIEGLVEFLVRDKGFKWVFPFQCSHSHFNLIVTHAPY